MIGGRSLYLHEVLYALDIQWNVVSVLILLKLGYNLNFFRNYVKIIMVLYLFGFLLNGFMVLDTFYYDDVNNISFSLFVIPKSMNVDVNVGHDRLRHIGQECMNRLAHTYLWWKYNKKDVHS